MMVQVILSVELVQMQSSIKILFIRILSVVLMFFAAVSPVGPETVETPSAWRSIAAWDYHSLAVETDGTYTPTPYTAA
jgi:hypothetical protein